MEDKKLIWWEKTVEYKFIMASMAEAGMNLAAPLAGSHETGGDGIFAAGAKLILVEFKRDLVDFKAEHKKYKDFSAACKALCAEDGHHFLVWGVEPFDVFNIEYRTYFSTKKPANLNGLFTQGTDSVTFNAYLTKLLSHKKADARGSGSLGAQDMASVIGIKDQNASATSLQNYCERVLKLTPKIEVNISRGLGRM